MKANIFFLSLLFSLNSCKKSNDAKQNNSDDSIPAPVNNQQGITPIPPYSPDPSPAIIEKNITIKFSDGEVIFNNKSGDYNILKVPEKAYNFDLIHKSNNYYDSYIKDDEYIYKSALFPVKTYSLYKIPALINVDELNPNLTPKEGDFNAFIQIWGLVGSIQKAYKLCYSFDKNITKFRFAVDDYKYSKYSCNEINKLVENKEIKPLELKENDFIFLRVYGYREYSSSNCEVNTCKLDYNFPLKYYTETK